MEDNTKHQNFEKYFEKYLDNMKERGYSSLQSPDHIPTIDELAAEGEVLLKAEGVLNLPLTESTPENKLEMTLGKSSENPYIRARMKVLTDMPTSRRNRVLKLEADKNLDHPDYKEFVKMVIKLGNEFSNEFSNKNKNKHK